MPIVDGSSPSMTISNVASIQKYSCISWLSSIYGIVTCSAFVRVLSFKAIKII